MKQAKEKEVALLYLDNNNLKSLNKGLERDIKKLEKLLSLTSDTCEQQVNELMEQQKEIEQEKYVNKGFIKDIKAMNMVCGIKQKEIDDLMESIKNVLEAVDESKKVDALFELKNLYKAKLKRTK